MSICVQPNADALHDIHHVRDVTFHNVDRRRDPVTSSSRPLISIRSRISLMEFRRLVPRHDVMGLIFAGGPTPGTFALFIDDVRFK